MMTYKAFCSYVVNWYITLWIREFLWRQPAIRDSISLQILLETERPRQTVWLRRARKDRIIVID